MRYKCEQKMQSTPRITHASFKTLRPLQDKPNTVSVIPQIATPNQILPKQLLLSKPTSHLFAHNCNDIQASSASLQALYDEKEETQEHKKQQQLFSLYQGISSNRLSSSPSNKTRPKINKLLSFRDFFLNQSQDITFISRTACFALKQHEIILFRKLANTSKQNLLKSLKATFNYHQQIKKLLSIFQSNQKFPFLCPQLNQTITEKHSLNNLANTSGDQDFLTFDDNFQCSNILMVKKYKPTLNSPQIHCICTRFDYQTASYGQWFYFSVKRQTNQIVPKKKFKFIICNMTKRYSMLGLQMKISVCRNGVWTKQGENIRYYQTMFKRGNKIIDFQSLTQEQRQLLARNHQFYYALEFDLQLEPFEQILVSYNEPYTLSKLNRLIDSFSKVFNSHMTRESVPSSQETTQFQSELKSREFLPKTKSNQPQMFFKRQVVCETPLKNQLQCLTFSMKKQFDSTKGISTQIKYDTLTLKQEERKIIFIMARAHPIETAGSFVLDGLMRNLFLFSEFKNDSKRKEELNNFFQAQNKGALLENLFDKFVIKIIPMINPDGVVIGNSRCNFFGLDLNRQWKRSNKYFSQQIYNLKRFLLKFKERIEMVIDLHGHSKERNVFAYGMHDFKNPFLTREFPYILSKITEQNFLFNKCRFTRLSQLRPRVDQLQKQQIVKENAKEGTARIWLFRKLQIPNIFTIENSYCGSIYSKYHYDSQTYGNIGKQILLGICYYFINYSDKKERKRNRKNSGTRSFEEDRFHDMPSKALTIHDLKSFKESILMDLQSKEENATMGIESINSSQSEEERRVEDQIVQKPLIFTKKDVSGSPNKSKSHHVIKKSFDQKPLITPNRFSRYSTAMEDEEKPYNFKLKLTKAQSPLPEEDRLVTGKMIMTRNPSRHKSRYMSNEGERIKGLSTGKRSPTNHKSTVELQKNVTLSIVDLGFEKAKLMDTHGSNKNPNNSNGNNNISERRNNYSESPTNAMMMMAMSNYPHLSGSTNAIIIPHHHYHHSLINNRLSEKIHQNLVSNSQNLELKFVGRKPSQTGNTTEMIQRMQQRRNVSEFMKKIESNRKLQTELVATKKKEKYKEIIMKISGGKT